MEELLVPIQRVVDKVDLINEEIEPKVNAYIVKNKVTGKYLVQISIMLHDGFGNTVRNRSTISLPEEINTDKKADRQLNCIEREIQTKLHERFETMEQHDFMTTMKAWLGELQNMVGKENQRVNQNTLDGYLARFATIENYFDPLNLSVEQIIPVHINNFIEWALREGRFKPLPNGETGLSRRTVKDIHGLLFNFFNDAIKYGTIKVNPCVGGTSLSYHKKKRHIEDEAETWLSVETYHKFLSWMEEAGSDSIYNKLIPIVKIVIRYGLRREELLALRWDVVSDGHIEIKRTRVKGKAIYDVEDVKSDASHRRYPITKEVEGILREIRERQQELNIYREDGYIFCWDDGRPYRPDYISSLFKKAITRCPYVSDDLHFHSLRHSTCSILAEEGWALEHIQAWVGHADSEITRRIYIHVRDNWKDAKADDLDEIWSRHCD